MITRAAHHGTNYLENMKASNLQDEVQKREADLAFLLPDRAATLEPVDSAVEAAGPTKKEKGDFLSRQVVQTAISQVVQLL